MNDHHGLWVYAVTHRSGEDLHRLTGVAGVAGAAVLGAPAAGLTVLVSRVGLAEFGEQALRANLEDLQWLEDVARAHHSVVDAAARRFPVLPARFATVYSSDTAMAAAFAGQRDQLRAGLRRVAGCVEWGVKAYAAGAANGDTDAAVTGGAGTGGAAPGAGMAYLRRRKAELSARKDAQRNAAAGAGAVHAELSGRVAQARLYPPQATVLSGSRTPMLLNAAYLLDSGGKTRFAAAVAAAGAAHPEVRLELSGPWPPYSFAALEG